MTEIMTNVYPGSVKVAIIANALAYAELENIQNYNDTDHTIRNKVSDVKGKMNWFLCDFHILMRGVRISIPSVMIELDEKGFGSNANQQTRISRDYMFLNTVRQLVTRTPEFLDIIRDRF